MAERTVTRKPLARLIRRVDAARLEIRRTFRFDHDRDLAWQEGAVSERIAFSEYVRECIEAGHSMKQAQRNVRRTNA